MGELSDRLARLEELQRIGNSAAPIAQDAFQGVVDGVSVGFGDEGAAALRAGAMRAADWAGIIDDPRSFNEIYTEGRDEARGLLNRAWERNPGVTLGGTIAGGLLPFAGSGGASAAATAPGIARSAAIGAAGGALGGFGSGEGLEDRLNNAAVGGALGGVAGPVLMGAGNVAGSIARGVTGTRTANGPAVSVINRNLQRDELTLPGVLDELDRRAPDGRGETMLDIAGPGSSTMALGEHVAQTPGPRMRRLTNAMQERVLQSRGRIEDDFREAFGGVDRNFYSSVDDLIASRSRAARPLYEQAYAAGAELDSPELVGLISTRVEPSAIRYAQRLMRQQGIEPPRVVTLDDDSVSISGTLSLEFVDYIKQAIDDQISSNIRAGNNRLARGLQGVRDDMLETVGNIETVGDLYSAARSAWAGPSELIDAAESGRNVFRLTPNEIRAELRGMGESERDSYVTGVFDAITTRISGSADSRDAASPLWLRQDNRDRVRAVIDAVAEDDEQAEAIFSRLDDALRREGNIAGARNSIVSNSATSRREAVARDMSPTMMGAFLDSATGFTGIPTALGAARTGMGAMRRRAGDRLNQNVGDILMQDDPVVLRSMLESHLGGGNGLLAMIGASPARQLPAFGLLGNAANDQDLPPLLQGLINR